MKTLSSIICLCIAFSLQHLSAQQICTDGEIAVDGNNGKVTFRDQTGTFDPFTYSIYHKSGNLFFDLVTPGGMSNNLRHNGSNLYVGETVNGPGPRLYVGSAGDGSSTIANAYLMYSDEKLKNTIAPLLRSSNKIFDLRPVSYQWNQSKLQDVGFLAQEVEAIFPNIVHTDEDSGLKSVDYIRLIPYLVDAIKMQQAEIDALKVAIAESK